MVKKHNIKFREMGIVIVLIVILLIFSIVSPQFLKMRNLFNITKQIATLGICAVGITFVLITGGIDLSLGYQISLINIVCAYMMVRMNIHWILAILISMIIGTGVGLLNGFIIVKSKVAPLIVTLSMMQILNGLSYIISRGLPIVGFPREFTILGQGRFFGIPISFFVLVIIIIFGAFLLNKTCYGRYCYAIGCNEEATKLSGVNTDRVKLIVYALCGLFTSIGAILLLSRLNSAQSATGAGFEFEVLTACVLGGVSAAGGKGKMWGTAIGCLIIGILDNGLVLLGVTEYIQLVIKGVILLCAVIYDVSSQDKAQRIKRIKSINADNE